MRKMLFTGASGFLGYNIRPILEKSYDVHTIGLTDDDDIKINIAKEVPPINTHYDVVLHAAGKAHMVPKTEEEKKVFYDVNYQGTVNLCTALEKVGVPKSLVFISTVAVYGCDTGELAVVIKILFTDAHKRIINQLECKHRFPAFHQGNRIICQE